MKILSKPILLTLAATLLGTGVGFSEHVVRRIDHPNGPATYIPAPHERSERVPTIGVYAGESRFHSRREGVVERSVEGRTNAERRATLPIHRGRGDVIHVPAHP